jgi:hypothetical protein
MIFGVEMSVSSSMVRTALAWYLMSENTVTDEERGPSHDTSGQAKEAVESSDSDGVPHRSSSDSGSGGESGSESDDDEETQVARPAVVKQRASVSLVWMEPERRVYVLSHHARLSSCVG